MLKNGSSLPGKRVAVTAMGIISPLGRNQSETVESLQIGKDCILPMTRFDVSQCRSATAGQIPDEWMHEIGTSVRHGKRINRASYMTMAAFREAAAQDPSYEPEFIVMGTTSGGMSFGESFFRSLLQNKERNRRAVWLANYSPQKPILDAQETVGWRASSQIIANACASGTNAIGHAFSLVRNGRYKRVLCGGYDAISELVFVGFDSLQASTPERCRPFDKERTGLVLGEGAAVLALEEWDFAIARGAKIIAEVTGYGISTDNYHLTQPHPSGDGPFQAMERALRSANREPKEIDYINAHGTATQFNDATEGIAIARLFGKTPVSSTKSMMGHSLGAAGAIEAAICVLSLQHQFMPPNINFNAVDPAWDLEIVANKARAANLERVISNSFGFGGTNATLVMQKGIS